MTLSMGSKARVDSSLSALFCCLHTMTPESCLVARTGHRIQIAYLGGEHDTIAPARTLTFKDKKIDAHCEVKNVSMEGNFVFKDMIRYI